VKILLLTVGRLKETWWREAAAEYIKRLSAVFPVEVVEIPDEKCPENAGDKDREKILKTEADKLLARMPAEGAHVVTLEIKGKPLDSPGLAGLIRGVTESGKSTLVFVIGGSLGLHSSVSERSHFRLSISPMTFPHQMTRIILLEQIYRGMKILRGEPYHK
jgi:23S rRNA (pseudouridine1915-N3)-methyltransferase